MCTISRSTTSPLVWERRSQILIVRQALNYAVDVEGIISALFNGKGGQATGLMTAADFGYARQPYALWL